MELLPLIPDFVKGNLCLHRLPEIKNTNQKKKIIIHQKQYSIVCFKAINRKSQF